MTAHDWQPGDVAMVECSDGEWRRAFCIRNQFSDRLDWWFGNRVYRYVSNGPARPLVVIDPETILPDWPGALLSTLLHASAEIVAEYAAPREVRESDLLMALADAFDAATTTPKPDEPTGLGAVIEDADGAPWVRWCEPRGCVFTDDWRRGADERRYAKYADITAVRVLSEGVTP